MTGVGYGSAIMSNQEKDIAQRIRMARRIAGLTQVEAARDLNVRERTYARWEKGGQPGGTSGFLQRLDEIAAVFGTTTGELLGEKDGEGSLADRMEAMERELRELKALLLDPESLKAAADALIESERER